MIVKNAIQLGAMLSKGRIKAELTQQDVADALKLSRATICAIESGSTNARISSIFGFMRICKIEFHAEDKSERTIEDIERQNFSRPRG